VDKNRARFNRAPGRSIRCGAIVNPDGLRNQWIGAMIQGLGGALFEPSNLKQAASRIRVSPAIALPRFRDLPKSKRPCLTARIFLRPAPVSADHGCGPGHRHAILTPLAFASQSADDPNGLPQRKMNE